MRERVVITGMVPLLSKSGTGILETFVTLLFHFGQAAKCCGTVFV
jgi:hypothetical protein